MPFFGQGAGGSGASIDSLADVTDVVYGPQLPEQGKVLAVVPMSVAVIAFPVGMAPNGLEVTGVGDDQLVVTLNGQQATITVPPHSPSFPDEWASSLFPQINTALDAAFGEGRLYMSLFNGPSEQYNTFSSGAPDDVLVVEGSFVSGPLTGGNAPLPATASGHLEGWGAITPAVTKVGDGGVCGDGSSADHQSVAFGRYATASGIATAVGQGTTAQGFSAAAIGGGATYADNTLASGGGYIDVGHGYSRCHGGMTSTSYQDVFAAGMSTARTQLAEVFAYSGGPVQLTPTGVIPTGRLAQVVGHVAARTDAYMCKVWKVEFTALNDGTTVSLIGAATVTEVAAHTGTESWTVSVSLTADGFAIDADSGADSPQWGARLNIMEV